MTRSVLWLMGSVGTVEFYIEVTKEAFNSIGVRLHGTRPEDVVGAATTKAATEVRREVADALTGNRHGWVLIISLNGGGWRRLFQSISLHCGFG